MTAQTAPERSGWFGPVTGRLKPGNAAQAKTGPSESKPGAPATCAALCAGYGGLETAARAVWPGLEVAWFAETDPHAATVFAAHHSYVPNLGDITQITHPPPVDLVTAGFPCQPVSTAGQRNGIHDERWLIDDVCRVAAAAQARLLVLENVRGLLTANNGDAMAHVCAALARHGYRRWEWCVVRASDVGAPHQRARWFCVAVADTVC